MRGDDRLNSPFHNAFKKTDGPMPANGDLTGHNPCPYFDQDHDQGPDTIPVVFEAGLHGRRFFHDHGEKAAISSPMVHGRNR